MKSYSMDIRARVIADYDAGHKTSQVAKRYGVSESWARRLKQHRRERGDIIPRTGGGGQTPKVDSVRLGELVSQKPDATLVELRESLKVDCSLWTICRALRRLNLTYKKKRSTPPSRTGRMLPKSGRSGR